MSRKRVPRLVVLAVLVGGIWVWRVRVGRASADHLGERWPVPHLARPRPAVDRDPASADPAPVLAEVPWAPREPVVETDIVVAPLPRPGGRPRRAVREPPPGAAAPSPDGSAPGPEYTIKGNAGSLLFHGPASPYFRRTKAEFWFRTPDDARAAGFTEWTPKRRASP